MLIRVCVCVGNLLEACWKFEGFKINILGLLVI
jgi:hypothetical protein